MDPALDIALTILAGFNRHYGIFRQASVEAKGCFERKEWPKLRQISRSRIDLYDLRVVEAFKTVLQDFPHAADDESLWPQIKKEYISLLYQHQQPECAETFFNSVAAKVLRRRYHDNQFIFSRPAVAAEHIEASQLTYRCYYPTLTGLRRALLQMFADFELVVPLANSRRCARNVYSAFKKWNPGASEAEAEGAFSMKLEPNFHIQVLTSLFYRNKAAYAVGRVVNGHRKELFAIALRHAPEGGLLVDAVINDRAQLANFFSVANAYFLVDMEVPSSWVSFIHAGLPEKPKAELYTAVGLQKQGKTEFFRDLNEHLKHSADRFVLAPGVRGMVMFVFTLPSFPFVFKCIRDSFEPPKDSTREEVMAKYQLVKHHDRVGRLADTLEYLDVALPADRFQPEVLEAMHRLIPSNIGMKSGGMKSGGSKGGSLLIKHLYIEQRLTPLDMYLRAAAANEKKMREGLREFGQALRDLAAANIFPGDLLPKNFGVSSHGRVLFYDYDEVCYLTECNFRKMPTARTPEDEMRAEPWYNVGPHDIFPEEFGTFLFNDDRARAVFTEMHPDLLGPEFWTSMQGKIKSGAETELFPYPETIRFGQLYRPS